MVIWWDGFSYGMFILLHYNMDKLNDSVLNDSQLRLIRHVHDIFFVLCCISPVFALTGDMLRIPRNFLPIIYITIILLLKNYRYNIMNKFFWLDLIAFFVICKTFTYCDFQDLHFLNMLNDMIEYNVFF